MQNFLKTIGLLILIGSTSAVADVDLNKGQALTDENCVRCHGTEVYTRDDRRVTSLPGLHKQVQRCEQMLGLTWFEDDINNVAGHLNQQFYKFDTK